MKDSERILDEAAEWVMRLDESDEANFDVQQWRTWMAASDEHQRAFQKMLKVWGLTDELFTQGLIDTSDIEPIQVPVELPEPKINSASIYAIAASLLVLPLAAVMWFAMDQDVVETTPYGYAKTFQTQKKQHESYSLPDGSLIELGAQSQVQIQFSESARHVELLNGEGYFIVAKDAARPFTVSTDGVSARAVGTAFNVRNNSFETTVTVLEGIVEVKSTPVADVTAKPATNESSNSVLKVGEAIRVAVDGKIGPVTKVDAEQETAWRRGQLTFINRDLRSVVADLNRYSERGIHLDGDGVADLRFSGVVHMDGIPDWVDALPQVFEVDVNYTDNSILIRKRAQL